MSDSGLPSSIHGPEGGAKASYEPGGQAFIPDNTQGNYHVSSSNEASAASQEIRGISSPVQETSSQRDGQDDSNCGQAEGGHAEAYCGSSLDQNMREIKTSEENQDYIRQFKGSMSRKKHCDRNITQTEKRQNNTSDSGSLDQHKTETKLDGSPGQGTLIEGNVRQGRQLEETPEQGRQLEGTVGQGRQLVEAPGQGRQLEGPPGQGRQLDGAPGQGRQLEGILGQGRQLEGPPGQGRQLEGILGQGRQLDGPPGQGRQLDGAPGQGRKLEGILGQGRQLDGAPGQGRQLEGPPGQGRQLDGAPGQGRQLEGILGQGRQLDGAPGQGRQLEGPPGQGRQLDGAPGQGRQLEGILGQGRQLEGPPGQGRQLDGAPGQGRQLEGILGQDRQLEGALGQGRQLEGAFGQDRQLEGALGQGRKLEMTLTQAELNQGKRSAESLVCSLVDLSLRGRREFGTNRSQSYDNGSDGHHQTEEKQLEGTMRQGNERTMRQEIPVTTSSVIRSPQPLPGPYGQHGFPEITEALGPSQDPQFHINHPCTTLSHSFPTENQTLPILRPPESQPLHTDPNFTPPVNQPSPINPHFRQPPQSEVPYNAGFRPIPYNPYLFPRQPMPIVTNPLASRATPEGWGETEHVEERSEVYSRESQPGPIQQPTADSCTTCIAFLLDNAGQPNDVVRTKRKILFSLLPSSSQFSAKTIVGLAERLLTLSTEELHYMIEHPNTTVHLRTCVHVAIRDMNSEGKKLGHLVEYFMADSYSKRVDIVKLVREIHQSCAFCQSHYNRLPQ